jgi:hypothetical protein
MTVCRRDVVCSADAVALAASKKLSREQEQLEKLISYTRHGKYSEIEEVRWAAR